MSVLYALLITLSLAVSAWAQAPPTTARTVDGNTVCQPSYQFQYPNGSLTCGTVGGLPTAIVNLGATPGTLPWSSVTSATSTQTMTMSGAGSMRPLSGGTIEANLLQTGTVNLTGPTNTGMTASGMYVGDTAAGSLKIVSILECNDTTEKLKWNATTRTWQCITDQGGATSGLVQVTVNDTTPEPLDGKIQVAGGITKQVLFPGANEDLLLTVNPPFSTLTPDTNTVAGNFIFGGTANFDVQSQIRVPSSTSPPAVDRELKIAETGDGTLVNKPQVAFQSGGQNIFIPAPLALPTADAQALTYNVATQEYVWKRPNTVGVDSTDTANFLETKVVAGANITITKIGAVGSRQLSIASTGGGAGNPGGVNQNMQYNDNGTFGGFGTYNNSTQAATFPGTVSAGGSGAPGQLDLPNTARTFNNSFVGPATSTANRTCQLLDADAMIPASCVQGATAQLPTFFTYFDFAGSHDGTNATSNWFPETGTVTPQVETAGVIRDASLAVAAAGTTCLQRKWSFTDETDFTATANGVVRWTSDATGGTVTLTLQAACWDSGELRTAVTLIGAAATATPTTGAAESRNSTVLSPVDLTGCTITSSVYLRVCQTANTLTGGTNNTARLLQFGFSHGRQ